MATPIPSVSKNPVVLLVGGSAAIAASILAYIAIPPAILTDGLAFLFMLVSMLGCEAILRCIATWTDEDENMGVGVKYVRLIGGGVILLTFFGLFSVTLIWILVNVISPMLLLLPVAGLVFGLVMTLSAFTSGK